MKRHIEEKIIAVEGELSRKIEELQRLYNAYREVEIKIQILKENKKFLEELLQEGEKV